MRRNTRSSRGRGLDRSSTPLPSDSSLLNTTALQGFENLDASEIDSDNFEDTLRDKTILETSKMAYSLEAQDQISGTQLSAEVETAISKKIQSELNTLEDRLISKLSNLLESQKEHMSGSGNRISNMSESVSNRNVNLELPNNTSARPSENIEDLLHRVRLSDSSHDNFKRLEMHRWNLSFSGDHTGLRVDEFIIRVEHIAVSQRYSLEEVARNMYIFLKGLAASWYFRWLPRNPNASWLDLKTQLEDHFRTAETDCDIEHTIMNRTQRVNESFDQFYHVITELNSRMKNMRSDTDLIEILKRNVHPKMTVFIHGSKSTNLSEFLKECRRAERELAKVEGSLNRSRHRVNEINFIDEILESQSEVCQEMNEVNAMYPEMKYDQNDHSKIRCFDCKKLGHVAINCQEKSNRIFCYRCGKDDYVVYNCPVCKVKNGQKSWKTGNPSS